MAALAGAAISAIPEIYKLVQSGQDKKLAQKYLDTPRPQFRTPEEVFRAYQRMQMLAGQPMPGVGYMEEDLEEGTSSGVRALQELNPTEAVAGTIGLYGQQLDARRKIGSEQETLRREMQGTLGAFESGTLAEYKNRAFEINKFQPYQDAQAAARALLQSSEQNQFSGLSGMSQIGTTLAGMMGGSMKTGSPERSMRGSSDIDAFFGGDGGARRGSMSSVRGVSFDGTPYNKNYHSAIPYIE